MVLELRRSIGEVGVCCRSIKGVYICSKPKTITVQVLNDMDPRLGVDTYPMNSAHLEYFP